MEYKRRIEIQRLYNEEGLDARAIAERLDEPESTIRYHIKHPPKLRQPLPEPPPRAYLPEPQSRAYLPPAPIQAQPQNYIDAEWWEDEPKPERNHRPHRALPPRDEQGRFLPRGSEPAKLARRETPPLIAPYSRYDLTSDLAEWIGRKLISDSPQADDPNEGAQAGNPYDTCPSCLQIQAYCRCFSSLLTGYAPEFQRQAMERAREERLKQHNERARKVGLATMVCAAIAFFIFIRWLTSDRA